MAHFSFSSDSPRHVYVKKTIDGVKRKIKLIKDTSSRLVASSSPEMIAPKGWYLYNKIRDFVPLIVRTWFVHYHGRGHYLHLTMNPQIVNTLEDYHHIKTHGRVSAAKKIA